MLSDRNRERPEKILVAMLKLSNGTTQWLKYEDIVVMAFELFPDEFALRGYPKFPDSSDVHKPLYGVLKRGGMVRAANKTFSLTQRGVETARRLASGSGQTLEHARNADRMTRDVRLEVERMLASAAYKLHVGGRDDRVLDTDFYAFLGCTVRTSRNDFLGRLASSEEAVKAAQRFGQPDPKSAEDLGVFWSVLLEKFNELVERRRARA
jgi:hypothetical protein